VLAVEYRGWGDSSRAVPTEASIHADADIGWAELMRRQPDPRKRVIFGHSMGGSVAVHLASRQSARASFAGLILESTFTQLPDVAAQTTSRLIRPLAVLSGEHMNSLARIGNIRVPLLMLHGDADRTVPIELGRELCAAAATEPKQFVVVPGGPHSQFMSNGRALPARDGQLPGTLLARHLKRGACARQQRRRAANRSAGARFSRLACTPRLIRTPISLAPPTSGQEWRGSCWSAT
jgi:fermentation-respiration switch protein FrsA (DUF1100 family)